MSFYQSIVDKISLLERRIEEKKNRDSHLPWYLKLPEGGKTALPWFIYAEEMPDKLRLRFYKILLALVRISMIVRGAPSSNFHVFTQAGKEGVYICNYTYCHYKSFHKNTKWKFIAMVTAATIVVSLIVALVFPGEPRARAALKTWTQTDWSGGYNSGSSITFTTQGDPVGKTYNDNPKGANIVTGYSGDGGTIGDAKLSTIAGSWTQTDNGATDTGFNNAGAARSQTVVSGSGAAGKVSLDTTSSCYPAALSNAGGGCWWNRRPITITGSADGILTDYQVLVKLTTADMGNPYSNVNTDGSDIRFTNASGTELSYWIDTWNNAGDSLIWVKVDSIAASPTETTLYMYYKNTSATTSSSSGSSTFALFDDFNDGDQSAWTNVYGTWTEAGGIRSQTLTGFDNCRKASYRTLTGLSTYVVTAKMRMANGIPNSGIVGVLSETDNNVVPGNNTVGVLCGAVSDTTETTHMRNCYSVAGGFNNIVTGLTLSVNTWYMADAFRGTNIQKGRFYNIGTVAGAWQGSGTAASLANTRPGLSGGCSTTGTWQSDFDYFYVRNATANEPTNVVGADSGQVLTYYSSGTFTSHVYNTGFNVQSWGNISWSTTQTAAATQIELRAKSGSTSSITGIGSCPVVATITSTNAIDATGYSLYSSGNGASPTGNTCVTAGDKYIQYQAALSNTDTGYTPSLDDITLNFNYYPASQFLTSTPYNSENAQTILSKLTWTEDLTAGNVDINFQLRTAPDSGSAPDWTNGSGWCGPSDCGSPATGAAASSFYTDPAGGEAMISALKDGYKNQWIQYKVWLYSSTGQNTPILSTVNVEQNINTPPSFTVTSPASQTNDTVNATYNLSDAEQTTANVSILADIGVTLAEILGATATEPDGQIAVSDASLFPTSGTIQVENEQITYTGKSVNNLTGATRAANGTKYASHSSGAVVWIKGTTVTGGGSQSMGTGKTIAWNIKTDLPGVFRNSVSSPAKIRLTAIDGEIGNPVGTADSSNITIDTKNPAGGTPTVIVNSTISSPTANLTLSVTDDSSYQMRFANAANQTTPDCATDLYNKTEVQIPYVSYAASYAFYPLSPDTAGISAVCYEFKDAYNNKLQGSVSTPATPASVTVGDTSYGGLYKYRNLVWWTLSSGATQYNIKRCEIASTDPATKCDSDANFTSFATVSSASQNYCFDQDKTGTFPIDAARCATETIAGTGTPSVPIGLETTTKYCYKVMAQKSDSFSSYSTTAADTCSMPTGDLTGKAPEVPLPAILTGPLHNGSSTDGAVLTTLTSATITWTTDIDSYSLVKYSTDSALLTGVSTAGSTVNQSAASHSVELTNLEPGTTYYYQAISGVTPGPSSIVASVIKNFVTKTPAIDSVPETTVTPGRTFANITWTTDAPATSRVYYLLGGTATQAELLATTPISLTNKTTNHTVLVNPSPSGLASGTQYSYLVESLYGPSNGSYLRSAVSTFTTASDSLDNVAPVISAVDAHADPDDPTNAAKKEITWTTTDAIDGNANSYSIVEYNPGAALTASRATAGDLTVSGTPASPVSHTVKLSGLTLGTQYAYRVLSGDAFGNLAASSTYTFGTDAAPVISSLTVPSYDRTSAVISWTTDKPAYSQIEYSKDSANSANLGTATALITPLTPTTETNVKVTQHTVVLTSLDQATDYYFRAVSNDGTSTTKSNISSFTTTGGVTPTITFSSQSFTETTADIIFKSDKDAFLSVMYTTAAVTTASPDSAYSSASSLMATADTNATISLKGLTSGAAYNYRLTARDIYGNTGRENQIRTFTTTADTAAPTVSTASTVSPAATSATITWTANESAKVKIEYSSTAEANCASATYASSTTLTANFNKDHTITLSSLSPSTKYCYRIYMEDAAANSATDSNSGAGYTFTTLPEPPTISGVSFNATPSGTTVEITWNTTQKSSSLVDFGTDIKYGTTQGNSTDSGTGTGPYGHSVTLVGLTPSTAYKFRVKSINQAGDSATDDNGGAGYSFTSGAASGPGGTGFAISSVVAPSDNAGTLTANTAVITWTTNFNADAVVMYGIGGSYNFESGDSSLSTSHTVTLKGLAPNTAYNFKVKSRSGANLDAPSTSYNFTTLAGSDSVPPIISTVQSASATSNKATITWATSENSNSRVEFGTASGSYGSVQGKPSDSTTAHSVELVSLTPSTVYYYQVVSADAAGNRAIDNNGGAGYTFSTTAGAAVDCPSAGRTACPACAACPDIDLAAPVITNIKVSDITFNTATVAWTTDENSNSMVGYDTYSYDIKGKYAYSSGNSKDIVKSHSVTLNNLDSASTYYFRVLSTDAKGNTAESKDQSFKTPAISESKDKGAATADTLKKEFEAIAKTLVKDNLATEENIKEMLSRIANPPVIGAEGPIVKDIKSYGATIVWQTDRKANSVVKFTSEKNTGSLSKTIGWEERGKANEFDTKHEVALLGLVPSTTYSFQAQSQDILGNTSSSEIKTFTTASASSIFNVLVSDLNLTSAKITWDTANISTTSLEYGTTSNYGNYVENKDEKVRNHSISLSNLAPDSVFHFRVRSMEEAGAILVSDDYSFSTPALPQITKYALGEVKDNSIALSWTSNIPINSNVRYTNAETNEVKNIGKEEKTIDHALVIAGLEAGKIYKIEIQGRDDADNLATVPSFDVQTGMDVVAPEISQVRSQSAVLSTADDKVQSIISWRTNELSSTKVLWDLGGTRGDALANESALDANLTTNHIVVLTQFKPGTVYRFRVASTDKFGNTTVSADYTVLAPVKRQSIIQMIINQFESIFGWTKGLGI